MSITKKQLLIVGGSYAATELAGSARRNGYSERILIVSSEKDLPYQRPPLSKSFMGTEEEHGQPLRTPSFYSDNDIDVQLGLDVAQADAQSNVAVLSDGSRVFFDDLALTVGARARELCCPGADLENIYSLRTIADAREIRRAARDTDQVLIVGAGFIGLELASSFVTLDKEVTVLEAGNRVLARAVAPETSSFLHDLHTRHGVRILTSRTVTSFSGDRGKVSSATLSDGTRIDAGIVIVGVGSVANTELSERLGLGVGTSIEVDANGRTSRRNVFAAGDCASFRGRFNTAGLRLESVQNATDQAQVAGASIAGVEKQYDSVPWFWSDQYDAKLQIAGLATDSTSQVTRYGAGTEWSTYHFYREGLVCVESVNRPREHIAARRLIPRSDVSIRDLQDNEFDLAALLKAKK